LLIEVPTLIVATKVFLFYYSLVMFTMIDVCLFK